MRHHLSFNAEVDATLHPIDVASELANMLLYYAIRNERREEHLSLLKDADAIIDAEGSKVNPDFRMLDDLIDDLTTALDEFAPPFTQFVRTPKRIGLEVQWTMLHDASLVVDDLDAVPRDYRGYVAFVNDHGNTTLYYQSAKGLREVWAVV